MNIEAVAINDKMSLLIELFPQGDFNYLKAKAEEFALDDSLFEHFINDALATNSIPQTEETQNETTGAEQIQPFDLLSFFEACPDPFNYFKSVERTEIQQNLLLEFLKDRFRSVKLITIMDVASQHNFNLIQCCNALKDVHIDNLESVPRADADIKLKGSELNKLFRLEVYLLDHEDEIRQHMDTQNNIRSHAIELGHTLLCECCFSDDILADEVVTCSEAHVFCKTCVKRSVEIQIGHNRLEFPCLAECSISGNFPLTAIKQVLDDKALVKLLAQIQEAEVLAAKITGLVQCQKCEYAAILDDSSTIFRCVKCSFTFCRNCNEKDHSPLKCHETVEEDSQKQSRKREEEFETYRVVRKCGRCKKEFIKIDGCNKVTCVCGNTICYVCGTSGIDYEHLDSGCPLRNSPNLSSLS